MNPDPVFFELLGACLRLIIAFIQPVIVPFCFVVAWSLVALAGWSLCSAIAHGFSQAKQMHQIPCANCQFFTSSYHLKCTVRPDIALSEAAIGCADYDEAVYGTLQHNHLS